MQMDSKLSTIDRNANDVEPPYVLTQLTAMQMQVNSPPLTAMQMD
jgi:hypothetical protein